MLQKRMYKVLAPIEKKDGTGTYWLRLGSAHTNKDESINIYLDAFPRDGKIQLRELSEEELRERDSRRAEYALRSPTAGGVASRGAVTASEQHTTPF
jgi:hypothetical protein